MLNKFFVILYIDDIDPVEVVICKGRKPHMFWLECPNVFLFKDSHHKCTANVWRRPLLSDQEDWELVGALSCTAYHLMSCALKPDNPESYEFAVSYDVGSLSGRKVKATEYHRTTYQCK